jgi:hypothetical protein
MPIEVAANHSLTMASTNSIVGNGWWALCQRKKGFQHDDRKPRYFRVRMRGLEPPRP